MESTSSSGSPLNTVSGWKPPYVFLAVVSLLNLVADLGSKYWAEKALERGRRIEIWQAHAEFILAKNRGGAWGILQDVSESIRRPFFLIVSTLAIVFIVSLYKKLEPHQRALRWGLGCVLGGALGNVVDRMRYGYVIDFIRLHAFWNGKDYEWPTFNVADISICIGVGLMAIDMFKADKKHKKTETEKGG